MSRDGDVYYYIHDEWYRGSQPRFHDEKELPGTGILQENFEVLSAEIRTFFEERGAEMQANFTPYAYREAGWKTVNLCSYFLRYPSNCARFPQTWDVVRRIPGMCMAQIAVLDPGTRVKAHMGDTDAVIRSHLGIEVPGTLPEIGIRIGREDRTWAEGEVFAFCISHRHKAWNLTDRPRVALVVDVIRPELIDRRYEIASKALAAIFMKLCATRIPRLKRLPRPVTGAIHRMLASGVRVRLWVQRSLGL